MQSGDTISSTIIPHSKIEFTGEKLGEGGFGVVEKARWQYIDVAVKKLKISSLTDETLDAFKQEAEHHWKLRHQNVVTLYGVCIEPERYCMVMELMPDGSLYKLLHSKKEISWLRRLDISKQIAIGLEYLHSQKIIHRDLKSLNVLIKGQEAKLADFGLSKLKIETNSTIVVQQAGGGSLYWLAPELMRRRGTYSELSDIYAMGMVFWEICSRKTPFEDSAGNRDLIIQFIKDGDLDDVPPETPQDFATLIKQCRTRIPSERPSLAGVAVNALEGLVELEEAKHKKKWHFDSSTKRSEASQVKDFELAPATQEDFEKVKEQYQKHPADGYELCKVEMVYNPTMNRIFAENLRMLQAKHNNPAFTPKFIEQSQNEQEREWRAKVHHMWQVMAAPYCDDDYPHVKLLPLWHGTSPTVLGSILKTGYANLAITDCGYFGRGLYSTCEADYAWKYYSKGTLILNWVASFSAYPIIAGDMKKIKGQTNYANYDAHFVPITKYYPNNPDNFVPDTADDCFIPCVPNQQHQYIEVVVFQQAQCLPRYVVTLQKSLLPSIPSQSKTETQEPSSSSSFPGQSSSASANQSKTIATTKHSLPEIEQVIASLEKVELKDKERPPTAKFGRRAEPSPPEAQQQTIPPALQQIPSPIIHQYTAPKPAPYIVSPRTSQELTKFLKHVGFGEQAEAEAMAQLKPLLTTLKGDLTDCSGRTFPNITAFQYAVWALDFQMWRMIKQHMEKHNLKQSVRAQMEELNDIASLNEQQGWLIKPGKSINWPLIDWTTFIKELDEGVKNYDAWNGIQCGNHWCQKVGGAQLKLPAHFINEYSHPIRWYTPIIRPRTLWGDTEASLPRAGVEDWANFNGKKLGKDFAWCAGVSGIPRGESKIRGRVWYGGNSKRVVCCFDQHCSNTGPLPVNLQTCCSSYEPHWLMAVATASRTFVGKLLTSRTAQARVLLDSVLNPRAQPSSPRP
jgi:serine/threonine protein kinase